MRAITEEDSTDLAVSVRWQQTSTVQHYVLAREEISLKKEKKCFFLTVSRGQLRSLDQGKGKHAKIKLYSSTKSAIYRTTPEFGQFTLPPRIPDLSGHWCLSTWQSHEGDEDLLVSSGPCCLLHLCTAVWQMCLRYVQGSDCGLCQIISKFIDI